MQMILLVEGEPVGGRQPFEILIYLKNISLKLMFKYYSDVLLLNPLDILIVKLRKGQVQ